MLTARRQQGLGLVELMVGVAIGLVLIAGASAIYVNSLRASASSSALVQVNQALRGIVSVIEFDLHRAGYAGRATAGSTANPFTVRASAPGSASTDIFISADQRCILYTFDLNVNGTVDANEFFGFWFDSASRRLMVLNQGGGTPVTDTAAISDCSVYAWQPMNFPGHVTLDSASFSTGGSQCVAYAPEAYNPASAPGSSYVRWQLDTAQANYRAACDTTVAGGATVPAGLLPAGTTPTVQSNHTARAEVRQITLTLTATHARDASATRTLSTAVRLRNDRAM